MNTPNKYLLYLHGFNSSPLSYKARATFDYWLKAGAANEIAVPELPYSPAAAMEILRDIVERQSKPVVVIGSSLGGYYATYLAEQYRLRGVFVNPAVNPVERWEDHLGEHINYYSGRRHTITREHIAELAALDTPTLSHPENYMLLAQTGDQTLDYRLAVDKYVNGTNIIQEGGNHAFEAYEEMLPQIYRFLMQTNTDH
ncbi:MAG: YqiA/YcfP family alpha/beta fold hydrolase [Pseudohongiellaceae bacterium]|nr:YqiA/YcfP family alpha/beta fold hydrolase [Pseudohongiellaceae bacterium]